MPPISVPPRHHDSTSLPSSPSSLSSSRGQPRSVLRHQPRQRNDHSFSPRHQPSSPQPQQKCQRTSRPTPPPRPNPPQNASPAPYTSTSRNATSRDGNSRANFSQDDDTHSVDASNPDRALRLALAKCRYLQAKLLETLDLLDAERAAREEDLGHWEEREDEHFEREEELKRLFERDWREREKVFEERERDWEEREHRLKKRWEEKEAEYRANEAFYTEKEGSLKRRMRLYQDVCRKAQEELQEMREAVGRLVERVEETNSLSHIRPATLSTTRLLEPIRKPNSKYFRSAKHPRSQSPGFSNSSSITTGTAATPPVASSSLAGRPGSSNRHGHLAAGASRNQGSESPLISYDHKGDKRTHENADGDDEDLASIQAKLALVKRTLAEERARHKRELSGAIQKHKPDNILNGTTDQVNAPASGQPHAFDVGQALQWAVSRNRALEVEISKLGDKISALRKSGPGNTLPTKPRTRASSVTPTLESTRTVRRASTPTALASVPTATTAITTTAPTNSSRTANDAPKRPGQKSTSKSCTPPPLPPPSKSSSKPESPQTAPSTKTESGKGTPLELLAQEVGVLEVRVDAFKDERARWGAVLGRGGVVEGFRRGGAVEGFRYPETQTQVPTPGSSTGGGIAIQTNKVQGRERDMKQGRERSASQETLMQPRSQVQAQGWPHTRTRSHSEMLMPLSQQKEREGSRRAVSSAGSTGLGSPSSVGHGAGGSPAGPAAEEPLAENSLQLTPSVPNEVLTPHGGTPTSQVEPAARNVREGPLHGRTGTPALDPDTGFHVTPRVYMSRGVQGGPQLGGADTLLDSGGAQVPMESGLVNQSESREGLARRVEELWTLVEEMGVRERVKGQEMGEATLRENGLGVGGKNSKQSNREDGGEAGVSGANEKAIDDGARRVTSLEELGEQLRRRIGRVEEECERLRHSDVEILQRVEELRIGIERVDAERTAAGRPPSVPRENMQRENKNAGEQDEDPTNRVSPPDRRSRAPSPESQHRQPPTRLRTPSPPWGEENDTVRQGQIRSPPTHNQRQPSPVREPPPSPPDGGLSSQPVAHGQGQASALPPPPVSPPQPAHLTSSLHTNVVDLHASIDAGLATPDSSASDMELETPFMPTMILNEDGSDGAGADKEGGQGVDEYQRSFMTSHMDESIMDASVMSHTAGILGVGHVEHAEAAHKNNVTNTWAEPVGHTETTRFENLMRGIESLALSAAVAAVVSSPPPFSGVGTRPGYGSEECEGRGRFEEVEDVEHADEEGDRRAYRYGHKDERQGYVEEPTEIDRHSRDSSVSLDTLEVLGSPYVLDRARGLSRSEGRFPLDDTAEIDFWAGVGFPREGDREGEDGEGLGEGAEGGGAGVFAVSERESEGERAHLRAEVRTFYGGDDNDEGQYEHQGDGESEHYEHGDDGEGYEQEEGPYQDEGLDGEPGEYQEGHGELAGREEMSLSGDTEPASPHPTNPGSQEQALEHEHQEEDADRGRYEHYEANLTYSPPDLSYKRRLPIESDSGRRYYEGSDPEERYGASGSGGRYEESGAHGQYGGSGFACRSFEDSSSRAPYRHEDSTYPVYPGRRASPDYTYPTRRPTNSVAMSGPGQAFDEAGRAVSTGIVVPHNYPRLSSHSTNPFAPVSTQPSTVNSLELPTNLSAGVLPSQNRDFLSPRLDDRNWSGVIGPQSLSHSTPSADLVPASNLHSTAADFPNTQANTNKVVTSLVGSRSPNVRLAAFPLPPSFDPLSRPPLLSASPFVLSPMVGPGSLNGRVQGGSLGDGSGFRVSGGHGGAIGSEGFSPIWHQAMNNSVGGGAPTPTGSTAFLNERPRTRSAVELGDFPRSGIEVASKGAAQSGEQRSGRRAAQRYGTGGLRPPQFEGGGMSIGLGSAPSTPFVASTDTIGRRPSGEGAGRADGVVVDETVEEEVGEFKESARQQELGHGAVTRLEVQEERLANGQYGHQPQEGGVDEVPRGESREYIDYEDEQVEGHEERQSREWDRDEEYTDDQRSYYERRREGEVEGYDDEYVDDIDGDVGHIDVDMGEVRLLRTP